MKEQKGHIEIKSSFYSCSGCKWLKVDLEISGQNPIYNYKCMNPKTQDKDIEFMNMNYGAWTPDWCPVLYSKEKIK